MLIRHNEQELATTLDLLVGHSRITEWEINQTKIQGHSTSVKVSGTGYVELSLLRGRIGKLLSLAFVQPRKTHEMHLAGLFGVWRQHIPHLGVLLWPIYLVTWKTVSSGWQQRLYNRSGLLCQLFCHWGHNVKRSTSPWSVNDRQGWCLTTLFLKNPPWASIETECLTTGLQVTTGLKIPIINWVLSDPTDYKDGHAQ